MQFQFTIEIICQFEIQTKVIPENEMIQVFFDNESECDDLQVFWARDHPRDWDHWQVSEEEWECVSDCVQQGGKEVKLDVEIEFEMQL